MKLPNSVEILFYQFLTLSYAVVKVSTFAERKCYLASPILRTIKINCYSIRRSILITALKGDNYNNYKIQSAIKKEKKN